MVTYDRQSGEKRWASRVRAGLRYQPSVTDRAVWVCDDLGIISALDISDGRTLVQQEVSDSEGAVAVVDDMLYCGANRVVYQIDRL